MLLKKASTAIELHWHGKFRGPDFTPIAFKLQPGTTERLKDSKGRYIWSVSAAPISEAEQAGMENAARRKQDQLLAWMKTHTFVSLADTAEGLGWKYKNGGANKTQVNRGLRALVDDKMLEHKRGRYTLTPAGKKAIGKSETWGTYDDDGAEVTQ